MSSILKNQSCYVVDKIHEYMELAAKGGCKAERYEELVDGLEKAQKENMVKVKQK